MPTPQSADPYLRPFQLTDAYAMGVTLLVCLTGLPALGLLERSAAALEVPSLAPSVADAAATWPDDVATAALEVVIGLAWRRFAAMRMPLAEALERVERVADRVGLRPGLAIEASGATARECVVCMVEPRAVRFGCGHACCCSACAAQLQSREAQGERRCPTCRSAIRVVLDVGDHVACEKTFVQPRAQDEAL